MNNTVIEKIEQPFNGTIEELKKLIYDYIQDHVPMGVFEGASPFLELDPSLTEPNLFFVVRSVSNIVKDEYGASKMHFDPNPPREGTILLREITKKTPRAKFICRAYTVACRRLAYALAGEIGPVPAVTKQADSQKEREIRKILKHLDGEKDETKDFVERYLRGEPAESLKKTLFLDSAVEVYTKYYRLQKKYPKAHMPNRGKKRKGKKDLIKY